VGVFLFPGPGGGDDFLERGVLGFPAEGLAKLFLASDQDGGIAGAAWGHFARNFATGDFFGRVEYFEDGKAAAVADVKGLAGNFFDGFERAEVGIGDVEDVDVVADAGAVGRGIVGTENFEVWDKTKGGVENFGNEVGFNAMSFAAFGGGASSVEIAESGIVQAGVSAIVGENFFEAEFGFAVGIDGIFGMVFGSGDGVRLAVSGGGGREDEFSHAVASYCVEEIDAGGDVGGVEGAGFADGFGDESFAGEVHDGVDLVFGEDFFYLRADTEIGLAENRFGRDGGGVAFLKIIEGDDLVAAGEEDLRADAADVACCSGNENVQGSDLAFLRKISLRLCIY
jgi:hypothetical protein